jgi:hypothetical protein
MKHRVASFLVPVLTAVVLLYQVLTDLQIAVMHGATLRIIGVVLLGAAIAGLLAAVGPAVVRVTVLAACTLLFLDLSLHLSGVFRGLWPEGRGRAVRDAKRVEDIHRIKAALDQYIARVGPLPRPEEYGEAAGVPEFWPGWWDLSSHDENHDGAPFLGFLADAGILPSVPVDPVNRWSGGDARGGQQYFYFLVPPKYEYAGGTCDPGRWHYMIGATDLEDETERPPARTKGSGCQCLWKDDPNFFQDHFDYVVCGSFTATPESSARAAAARRQQIAAAAAAKEEAERSSHLLEDRRRVSDLLRIRQGLETYLKTVGPLPTPAEYGEAERSNGGFWQGRWDVSTQDGDSDGDPFLDFLVESGVMRRVPRDPENRPDPNGDPRGGRQYVYMLAGPDDRYEGGIRGAATAANTQWVYLLGITDLRAEVTRPPKKLAGSGCTALWRDQPGFFEQHFDYVVCGAFQATPEARARAATIRAQQAAAAFPAKEAAAQIHLPNDRRRVADLHQIDAALRKYLADVGPLPAPAEYGESEHSKGPGFWQGAWDVSAEDGDNDGKPFLDFLVDSGTLKSVPVDPENRPSADGDPRYGRQYVYMVMPPGDPFGGGSCAAPRKEWVYLLGITNLRSELVRPPKKFPGSGCECLWRDQPNFFQQQFDYVLCGTFQK